MQSVRAAQVAIACAAAILLASLALSKDQDASEALQSSSDELKQGFLNPPDSAKPRVWWHWMNGNITKEGIERDLQWMKRVGIGGLQNFDGAWDTPQVVDKRLIYMTPPWQDAFRYAAELSDKLGLEFAIASSPGWSETGGPWVTPADGMKKLVWSTTRVTGHPSASRDPVKQIKLAAPPSVAGPFQDMSMIDVISVSQEEVEGPRFYRDVAVLAYRTPPALRSDPKPVKVTTSGSSADGAKLTDSDITKAVTLAVSANEPAWVQYDYGKPQRLRAASLARPNYFIAFQWVLEISDDGKTFHRVGELPDGNSLRHTTVSFPAVTARFLRLTIVPVPAKLGIDLGANAPGAVLDPRDVAKPVTAVELSELQFHAGARVNRFEEKAGFSIPNDYFALDSGASSSDEAVDPKDIIDLTGKMAADAALNWTPPPGEWTVLRLGYSLTGKTNYPASPEATGLEVDKLDKQAVKSYLDTYLGKFEQTVGPDLMGRHGIRAFLTDSIESEGQNWTPALIGAFQRRRGYDPTRWLPVLTGVIVGDAARSDRFLWDFRQTLAELMSEAHYAQVAESAHERGLTYYNESLEGYPSAALGDDLDMRQHGDIPMAAIWTSYDARKQDGIVNQIIDMRGAASVSHIFGQNLVAAESLTAGSEPWAFSPATLRPIIDLAFALGVNRPVIHTSVHQPVERKPGLTLGPYGQHFTRHETWAELAGPWIAYLSRSAYLLQQGRFAADVAWFYGEEGPLAELSENMPTDLPEGYGFDFVNANMLLNRLSAADGHLASPSGATYRLLYLGGSSTRMTLKVLRRLQQLSDQGVTIAGRRPVGSPSLADEGHEAEYQRLIGELWDGGKVIEAANPNAALARLSVAPDFSYDKPDGHVMFLHRKLSDGEIYFLTNRKPSPQHIEARFRVTGKRPELWHADSGRRESVSWRIEQGRTVVPLDLSANESLFVVFRDRSDKAGEQVAARHESLIITIGGDWQLSFEPGRGAPGETLTTELSDWSQSPQPGIRYFSGVGTYRKTFNLRQADLGGAGRILLDLGQAHELAEVTLNGKLIGAAWHAPFKLDATGALKAGTNTLEIRVANLWVNRLIGDKQPGATPVAFTVTPTYAPDAPLRPSGLIGPVTLLRRAL